jgi:hypothetical protein
VARRWQFTNDLSAGEIAPQYLVRSDAAVRNRAAKRARNVLLSPGGGYSRRWGSRWRADLPGDARIESIGVGASDAKIIVFIDTKFRVYNLDGTMAHEVTGCPWVTADLREMQIAAENDRIVVCSQAFFPQVLTFNGTAWSVGAFTFAAGVNGSSSRPYYRFAADGVSLAPSGYSGSVSLTTSAAFFVANHVGARIRYSGQEITVTAVTNGTTATGTVVGTLYPTITCTVGSTTGFYVGQVVEGKDTEIRGVVSVITNATTMNVQLIEGYTPFTATEKLTGPTAQATLSAVTTAGTPAATVDWDEQVISAARGYPGACALHRTRLLLGRFPAVENLMCASTVGDVTDFNVGTGADSDAIVETLGRDTTVKIRHFASTEQLVIFTEAGPFYVPEQVTAPLSPTNLELLQIGPESSGSPVPLLVAEGFVFSEDGSGRLMAVVPTGNVRRSWEISDLSELAYHLMGTPVELETVPASSLTDRLVCQLLSDGTMAVMNYRRGAENTAWSLWSTSGEWRSIAAAAGSLYVVSKRTINGTASYFLEVFDRTVYGDGVLTLAGVGTAATKYALAEDMGLWQGSAWLASVDLNASGVILSPPAATGAVQLGFDFTDTVELVPPIDGEYGLRPKIRICRAWLDVLSSGQVAVNGYAGAGYRSTGGIGGPVPLHTGQLLFNLLGRSRTQTLTISQDHGEPLEVRSITMEVTS